jgi:hypothetical protein
MIEVDCAATHSPGRFSSPHSLQKVVAPLEKSLVRLGVDRAGVAQSRLCRWQEFESERAGVVVQRK